MACPAGKRLNGVLQPSGSYSGSGNSFAAHRFISPGELMKKGNAPRGHDESHQDPSSRWRSPSHRSMCGKTVGKRPVYLARRFASRGTASKSSGPEVTSSTHLYGRSIAWRVSQSLSTSNPNRRTTYLIIGESQELGSSGWVYTSVRRDDGRRKRLDSVSGCCA